MRYKYKLENKFYKALLEQIKEIKIIDTHEHIRDQKFMRNELTNLFHLFEYFYCMFDFTSAGMTKESWDEDPNNIWTEWNRFQKDVQSTSYFKNMIRALKDLYGLQDNIITKSNWKILSEKIIYSYQNEEWYQYVLSKKANFSISLLDNFWGIEKIDFDSRFFLPVLRTNPFILGRNFISKYPVRRHFTQIEDIAQEWGKDIESFEYYLNLIDIAIKKYKEKNAPAIKICTAYERSLFFQKISRIKAEKIFSKKKKTLKETENLQDFMAHYIIQKATLENLPIQIHTGTFAGNANYIQNGNPLLLNDLFLEYPETKFILFHFSFPFIREVFALAKMFPNVYLDMCWVAMLSREIAIASLKEYFDLVPLNKLTWGGDSLTVEEAYGSAINAKEILSLILSEKIIKEEINFETALYIARKIFHDNAKEIYKL